MTDDPARAAALITAELIRTTELSELDAFWAWSRQRSRMMTDLGSVSVAATAADDGHDDSAVFEPDDMVSDGEAESVRGDGNADIEFAAPYQR